MLDPGPLVLVAGALFIGSALNALVGFGFSLATVPLMALAVGPKDAVVLSAVFGLLSNGGVAVWHRRDTEVDVTRRIVLGALVGMPVGLMALVALPAAPLQVAIGVVVLVAVVALARGWTIADPHPAVDVAAGVATGVLNTSVGVSGPPVVMDLQGRALAKGPFRATAASVFGLNGVVALALFAVSGQVHAGIVLGAVLALPAWPVGAMVGGRLHHRFPEDGFRSLVLVLLAVTAVVALAGALI